MRNSPANATDPSGLADSGTTRLNGAPTEIRFRGYSRPLTILTADIIEVKPVEGGIEITYYIGGSTTENTFRISFGKLSERVPNIAQRNWLLAKAGLPQEQVPQSPAPQQPNAGKGVGQPGFWEGLIPIWGSGRAAIDDFQNGRYIWGTINTAFAVTDIFLVKSW